jgi:xanthine dehydrogenase YagR molybdenum-binding subunit
MGASCQPVPTASAENNDERKYSFHSFGAQFVEVWVDEDLGTIRVKRLVSVHDIGRIMNEKTARSQIIGGAIFGIGQALMEETSYDERWANPVTRTLADYHFPVHLDVPEIDVYFINKPDPHISPIGARGAGEIGIVGVAAAVANAVFNATGKRLRDLPLTPDKLL